MIDKQTSLHHNESILTVDGGSYDDIFYDKNTIYINMLYYCSDPMGCPAHERGTEQIKTPKIIKSTKNAGTTRAECASSLPKQTVINPVKLFLKYLDFQKVTRST
jgi:hypothetical protein